MFTGIIVLLGIATWVVSYIAFEACGNVVGFHVHLEGDADGE